MTNYVCFVLDNRQSYTSYFRPASSASYRHQQQQQRKRTDPVSLYHRYNAGWSQSKFLKRVESKHLPGWIGKDAGVNLAAAKRTVRK